MGSCWPFVKQCYCTVVPETIEKGCPCDQWGNHSLGHLRPPHLVIAWYIYKLQISLTLRNRIMIIHCTSDCIIQNILHKVHRLELRREETPANTKVIFAEVNASISAIIAKGHTPIFSISRFYYKIWIMLNICCLIWNYWIIYFVTCLEVFWSVMSSLISAGPPSPPDPIMGCLIMFSQSLRLHCPLPISPGSHAWVSRHCYPIGCVIKSTHRGICSCSPIVHFLKFTFYHAMVTSVIVLIKK